MSKNAEGQSPIRPVWGTVHYVEHGYSLPRTTIYQGIKDGLIESRVVGVTPDKRGRRVIRLESVDEFIRALAEPIVVEDATRNGEAREGISRFKTHRQAQPQTWEARGAMKTSQFWYQNKGKSNKPIAATRKH